MPAPDRFARLQALFHAAADLDAEARAAFVGGLTGADADLAGDLRAMLAADATGDALLDADLLGDDADALADALAGRPAPLSTSDEDGGAADAALEQRWRGRTVGPYRIERLLGRGGMGAVFLATRPDVGKQVALKLVRSPLASTRTQQRFLLERKVLARLQHPSIAQLLDAGVTDEATTGAGFGDVPYFAMEYVEGQPLTRFCNQHALRLRERLSLFLETCRAVQHAHQRLVVHRDLKPSNILVTAAETRDFASAGGTPASGALSGSTATGARVKLLDFGIAKLLAPDDDTDRDAGLVTEAAFRTATGAQVMTPAYAAPEQVTGDTITTATDVYALGVLLYELLTGTRPHDTGPHATLATRRLDTLPDRPSTRVRTATTGSGASGPRPPATGSDLRGDLDAICLKALRPEPAKRYASAEALADDLARYLTGQPVEAREGAAAYRLGKFVQRNRALAGATAAVMLALVIGLGAALWQAQVAAAERDRAQVQASRAERELAKADEALNFLSGLFRGATPGEAKGQEVTARQLLDRGAGNLDRLDRPDVRGRLMTTIGGAYLGLGDLPRADSLTVQALSLLRAHAAEDTSRRAQLELAKALDALGSLRFDQTRFVDAERAFREALRIQEQHLPAQDDDLRQSVIQLGRTVSKQGRLREAARLQRRDYRLLRAQYEAGKTDSLYVAAAANNLSTTLQRLGLYEASLPPAREAVRLLGADGGAPDVSRSFVLTNLGLALNNLGRPLEGLPYVRQALVMRDSLLEAPHPLLAIAHHNVAEVLYYAGRLGEARRWSEEAQRRMIGLHGEEHAGVADVLHTYGQILHRQGDLAGAEAVHRRTERIRRAVLGDDHVRLAKTLTARALVHLDARAPAEAEAALRTAQGILARASAVRHPFGHAVDGYLGLALAAQGRAEEAEPVLRAAYDSLLAATEGQERVKAPRVAGALADLLAARDAPDAARWRARSARPDSLLPAMLLDVID